MSQHARPEHGGNIWHAVEQSGLQLSMLLDFSANINPLGPPSWLQRVIVSNMEGLMHYPDPEAGELRCVASRYFAVSPPEVCAGNGVAELLAWLPQATQTKRALIPSPAYVDYAWSAANAGLQVELMPLLEADRFALDCDELDRRARAGDLIFIGRPNNPTGALPSARELREVALAHTDAYFIIDEAFVDFVVDAESLCHGNRPRNVVVLRSLTKFWAIPGLRIGFAVADPELIARLHKLMPPWSVNSLAQAVGKEALDDSGDYAEQTRKLVATSRAELINSLRPIDPLMIFEGRANFLLLRSDRAALDARTIQTKLLTRGIAIRACDNYAGLDERYFRVAVRRPEENLTLVSALKDIFANSEKGGPPFYPSTRPRADHAVPALMFQGTSSGAGKSVLTAALCRILLQDGLRVAPFKAQNMSLNSFVTRDGDEMGRAQVVQAQACRLEPDVRMNPILLKPNSDLGSQVILCGKPLDLMDVERYIAFKAEAFHAVCEAYNALAAEYDVMLIEGAGSPAEVNLRQHDIVNMTMARYAQAQVLLVGDIDRGGVFAALVGTMALLTESERALVQGYVINRFRGRESLLDPALHYVEERTGRPVLGVIPHIESLGLPEEDSVELKRGVWGDTEGGPDAVEVVVLDLPHISNFTDFDCFRLEPDVRLRYVRLPEEIETPNALLLPGSKNVLGDLAALIKSGWKEALVHLIDVGRTEIVGICGGFQMLGEKISDPRQVESSIGEQQGIGLLPIQTVLAMEKTLSQVNATHCESELPVRGYEIHHGQTSGRDVRPAVQGPQNQIHGFRCPSRLVWGTYLHGIFDDDRFRRWFIDRLRRRRGLAVLGQIQAVYDLEQAFDRLASTVRDRIEMSKIYQMLGL